MIVTSLCTFRWPFCWKFYSHEKAESFFANYCSLAASVFSIQFLATLCQKIEYIEKNFGYKFGP